jgi:CNT family concentrative nucleoside transporter
MVGIGFILSNNRKKIRPRVILWGTGLQLLFALIILPSDLRLSWAGSFIFLSMILIYAFEENFAKGSPVRRRILLGTGVTLGFLLCAAVLVWVAGGMERTPGIRMLKVLLALSVLLLGAGILVKNRICRIAGFAAALPIGFALAIRMNVGGELVLQAFAGKVEAFLRLSDYGARFVFGELVERVPFAFRILPTIIFFSAVISILYYLGVMQCTVGVMARFMRWTMGTSGAETVSCTANIFVGQTEAPFLIRPYLDNMTLSELNAVMVGGFATIAGGVMAAYISMGVSAGHLIAASVMSAPAALVLAKVMHPETEHSKTAGDVDMPSVERPENLLDAASKGVTAGLQLALTVAAMLVAFIALIALVDWILRGLDAKIDGQWLGGLAIQVGDHAEFAGYFPGSLQTLFGHLFAPVAWCLGADWGHESLQLGNLLGTKISANEFVAYTYLGKHISNATLTHRTVVIATYALCGFANFGSIGIQIGGIGALAPGRRTDLAKIGLRAMIGGALASWMTAAIAGMLTS